MQCFLLMYEGSRQEKKVGDRMHNRNIERRRI